MQEEGRGGGMNRHYKKLMPFHQIRYNTAHKASLKKLHNIASTGGMV